MADRQTTVMVLVPGRKAISFVVPRIAPARVACALLLPLLTGVLGQRYVSPAAASVQGRGVVRAAMASVASVSAPVVAVSAALRQRAEARGQASQTTTVLPSIAAEPAPAPAAVASAPDTDKPARPSGRVLDVKAMLRTLSALRRGNASEQDVAHIPASGLLRLEGLHLHEAIAVHPFDSQHQADRDAMAQINHLLRCRITGVEKPIDPQLVEILVRLHALYGRAIQVISGHRQPHTIGTKPTSQHALGRAVDIRIPGVGSEELKRVALRLGARGVGLYPEKGFVHVDVRPSARYTWVYTAARGEQSDVKLEREAKLARSAKLPTTSAEEPSQEPGLEDLEPDTDSIAAASPEPAARERADEAERQAE